MSDRTLQAIAIQKSLKLSEQEAMKVLIFMAGMEAGRTLKASEEEAEEARQDNQPCKPPKQTA